MQDLANTIIYPHKDHVRSTRLHTDSTAIAVNYYNYDAWGIRLFANEGAPQCYQFTGKEVAPDSVVALSTGPTYHFLHRTYRAGIGAFCQVDPLLLTAFHSANITSPHTHLYIYARSNPVMLVDPLGLQGAGYREVVVGDENHDKRFSEHAGTRCHLEFRYEKCQCHVLLGKDVSDGVDSGTSTIESEWQMDLTKGNDLKHPEKNDCEGGFGKLLSSPRHQTLVSGPPGRDRKVSRGGLDGKMNLAKFCKEQMDKATDPETKKAYECCKRFAEAFEF